MPSKVTGRITGGGVMPVPVMFGPVANAANAALMFAPAHIAHQVFAAPAASDDNGYVLAQTGAALPDEAATIDLPLAGVLAAAGPDYPRNVIVTVTHGSAVVACSGTIYGKDEYGNEISAAWSVTAGTTSKTSATAIAFASVSRITFTCAADAQANTVIVGTGKVFGLQWPCACPSAVKETDAGVVVTDGTVVAASTVAGADARGTYTPDTNPNGSITFALWYLVNTIGPLA